MLRFNPKEIFDFTAKAAAETLAWAILAIGTGFIRAITLFIPVILAAAFLWPQPALCKTPLAQFSLSLLVPEPVTAAAMVQSQSHNRYLPLLDKRYVVQWQERFARAAAQDEHDYFFNAFKILVLAMIGWHAVLGLPILYDRVVNAEARRGRF